MAVLYRDIAAWTAVVAGRDHMRDRGGISWNEDDFAAAFKKRDEMLALFRPEIEIGHEFLHSRDPRDNAEFADNHAMIESALWRALSGPSPTPSDQRLVGVLERIAPEWVTRVRSRNHAPDV